MTNTAHYSLSLDAIDPEDTGLIGEQAANLGKFHDLPIALPPGFIISTRSYYAFLHENRLDTKIPALLEKVIWKDESSIQKASLVIQKEILHAKVPDELVTEIFNAYKNLGGFLKHATVSLRTSLSISPVHKSKGISYEAHFLHTYGESEVLVKIKEIWAGYFEYSLLKERYQKHIDQLSIGIAIIVSKTLSSSVSGILFTQNPLNTSKQTLLIEAVYGLEQFLLKDSSTSDTYEVQKGTGAILTRKITPQQKGLFLHGTEIKEQKIASSDVAKQKIPDDIIRALTTLAKQVQKLFYFPQQLIWAIEDGQLYILSCHPMTTMPTPIANERTNTSSAPLLKGTPTCPGIATGTVTIIRSDNDIAHIHPGEIAVTDSTDLKRLRLLHSAAGIIIEKEMTTSAMVALAHEIRKPVIVGIPHLSKILKNHMVITMNGSNGEIYQGGFENRSTMLDPLTHTTRTQTKLYGDLSDVALSVSDIKHSTDGIIVHGASSLLIQLGAHPKLLIQEKRQNEYTNSLTQKLGALCEQISPRPVIFEFTDCETSVLKKLRGGKEYEPKETNPLIGFHGAFRNQFDHTLLDMEIAAITYLRHKKNHKNLWVSIPFVRTPKELEHIKKLLTQKNLYRTPTCKIFFSLDVPANSILLEKYLHGGIDGVLVHPEKLASLLMGVDFSHPEFTHYFSVSDESVIAMLHHIATVCEGMRVPLILSQSTLFHYPDLITKYVTDGISTLSILPSDIAKTREYVAEVEKKLVA